MSETTEIPSILTNDNTGYKIEYPLLPKGEYVLTVTEVKLIEGDKGQLIKISTKTTEDHTSVLGKPVKKGFPFFDNISLVETPTYDKKSITDRLVGFQQAAGFPTGGFFPLERYAGATVRAVVRIQPEKDGYPERNSIGRNVVPKAA